MIFFLENIKIKQIIWKGFQYKHGMTANATVVQQTIIDTFHKDHKP